MRAAAGFTLIEVMIALAIVGLATAALLQAAGAGLAATGAASHYEAAMSRARSRLAATTRAGALRPADNQGDDGGGYHWRVRVTPAASTTVRQAGPSRGPSLSVTLYRVDVEISWQETGRARHVELESAQVAASLP